MNDHRSKFSNLSSWKEKPEKKKNQGRATTRGKGLCHSVVFMNRQSPLGDICFALSIFWLQLKLELLPLQILGFNVPPNSRHFMMFTWSNRLALNNVKTVLQVHKKTHKAQRARYRRYNVAVPLIIFKNFSFRRRVSSF